MRRHCRRREPSHWEAYPHHQFLHTIGALPCCDHCGCWKSRVEPLRDGDPKDGSLCLMPVALPSGRKLPKCLDMITASDVIDAVENYLEFYGASERSNGKGSAAIASVQPISPLVPNSPSPLEVEATMKTNITREQMEAFARGWQSAEKNKLFSSAELKDLHAKFMADDERGVTWTVGVRTLKWHRLEAGQWVPGVAPTRLLLDQQVLVRLGQLLPAAPAAVGTSGLTCSKCGTAILPVHKFCISWHAGDVHATRTCQRCGKVTTGQERFCGSCGAEISPKGPAATPQQPAPERRCPACRQVVPPKFKFSTACGTHL